MKPFSRLEITYLILAGAGAALPLTAFLPWLRFYGLDVPRFVQEIFASRISAFFAWDVIISAIVVIVAVVTHGGALPRWRKAAAIAGTLLVGVSLGLPLLLFFLDRERAVQR